MWEAVVADLAEKHTDELESRGTRNENIGQTATARDGLLHLTGELTRITDES